MDHPVARRTLLAGLAAAPVAALALPGPAAAAGAPGIAERLTQAFTAYGNSGRGWTGADSTYSVRLPGDRQLWLFSDTFLGTVDPDGSRPADSPIVNNTFVVQRGGTMTTIHGGTAAEPAAILSPDQADSWYWLGGAYLGAGALNVMFLRFERFGPGMWDWAWKENVLARFDIATLAVKSVHPMPSAATVQWASWLQRIGGHTYVHGVEDLGLTKYMHVARVAGDDLRRPWEYFTGDGWSASEQDSARVMAGVGNEYSVTPWRDRWLLVTQDTNTLFSNEIVGYTAPSPTGPFGDRRLLHTMPESGLFGSYGDPDVITYNAHEHPELRRDDTVVITYNVNSLTFTDVLEDVTKYRPRFVEVQLAP
ncbi:DUF4185 domain-containing protein [Hamadaea sp. NPDC050747]|uniref:DUF4185 domain-containing protein n=1 Tax=Hamadaea sp. NPDC050747 TaxID=3155789 RepID=UPI0033EBD0A1